MAADSEPSAKADGQSAETDRGKEAQLVTHGMFCLLATRQVALPAR
jgi:hypothetical protein